MLIGMLPNGTVDDLTSSETPRRKAAYVYEMHENQFKRVDKHPFEDVY